MFQIIAKILCKIINFISKENTWNSKKIIFLLKHYQRNYNFISKKNKIKMHSNHAISQNYPYNNSMHWRLRWLEWHPSKVEKFCVSTIIRNFTDDKLNKFQGKWCTFEQLKNIYHPLFTVTIVLKLHFLLNSDAFNKYVLFKIGNTKTFENALVCNNY